MNRNQSGPNNPNWTGGISKQPMRYKRAAMARHPEKAKAYAVFAAAIRRGDLVRPERCEWCGQSPDEPLHGHHHDYSKPLDVSFLCRPCHRLMHQKNAPSYTFREVCARLGVSRMTLYSQEARLRAKGVLVELLPRIGTIRRFEAAPIDRYLTGGFISQEVRSALKQSVGRS